MAKYQGAYREDVYKEPVEQEENVQEAAPVEEAPASPEEATFKKRYGDLRRHMQQTEANYKQELEELRKQLEASTKKEMEFPKTKEEVEEWSRKYPDVAKIIDTIAQQRISEAVEEGNKELDEIRQFKANMVKERAMLQLKKLHPDFDKIRATEDFHNWVSEQPKYIQDALYKNSTDAQAAARAIDLYKADKGIRKKRVTKESAAQAVGQRSTSQAPVSNRVTFTESQVAKMSPREYEANQDAIMEAMRKGQFEYDISGAAS